jgi:hypothetical protein
VNDGGRQPIEYKHLRRKVHKPVPDVAFLIGWMAILFATYIVFVCALMLAGRLAGMDVRF